MNAFLTGATGFIGRHLATRLSSDGHRIRCLVRRPEAASWLGDLPGVEILEGDLADEDALLAGVAGADLVFHLAACTSAARREAYFEVNGRATGRVASVAARYGAPGTRMIYVSSLSAAGPRVSARRGVG